MTQRHQSTTVCLLLALGGRSPGRAAEAGSPAGVHTSSQTAAGRARRRGSALLEQLAKIHGGIRGIKEKVHLPIYDAISISHTSRAKAILVAAE